MFSVIKAVTRERFVWVSHNLCGQSNIWASFIGIHGHIGLLMGRRDFSPVAAGLLPDWKNHTLHHKQKCSTAVVCTLEETGQTPAKQSVCKAELHFSYFTVLFHHRWAEHGRQKLHIVSSVRENIASFHSVRMEQISLNVSGLFSF